MTIHDAINNYSLLKERLAKSKPELSAKLAKYHDSAKIELMRNNTPLKNDNVTDSELSDEDYAKMFQYGFDRVGISDLRRAGNVFSRDVDILAFDGYDNCAFLSFLTRIEHLSGEDGCSPASDFEYVFNFTIKKSVGSKIDSAFLMLLPMIYPWVRVNVKTEHWQLKETVTANEESNASNETEREMNEADTTPERPEKRRIQGNRLAFLIFAIVLGTSALIGIITAIHTGTTGEWLSLTIIVLLFALFLWLFLRKGTKQIATDKSAASSVQTPAKSIPTKDENDKQAAPLVQTPAKPMTTKDVSDKPVIKKSYVSFALEVAAVEQQAGRMTDENLKKIYAEYFAPNKEFYSQPESDKSKAYFAAINAATLELLNNPVLFSQSTKREHSELVEMCNNRIPGITNSLICGLIFCVGKYGVVPSNLYCVDFSEDIPNCIALYLLLTAQKMPIESRRHGIDAGEGTDTKPLSAAMDALSVCDPNWKYQIF